MAAQGCCEVFNEISNLQTLCRHLAYGPLLPCLQGQHKDFILWGPSYPSSVASTVKRPHDGYHLSQERALAGTQANERNQGNDEGHSREKNPRDRRQASENASEYSPPQKEALLPLTLQSHPNSFASGSLAKKRCPETGTERGGGKTRSRIWVSKS